MRGSSKPCYRSGENEAGTTSLFSCLTNMPRVAGSQALSRGLRRGRGAFGGVLVGAVNDPTCRPTTSPVRTIRPQSTQSNPSGSRPWQPEVSCDPLIKSVLGF